MIYSHNLSNIFESVALDHFSATAIEYENLCITYNELLSLSNRVASILINLKCVKGDLIAICNTKKSLCFALMIASFRLGISYVNIDSESALLRNKLIIEKSNPKYIFYDDLLIENNLNSLKEIVKINFIYLNYENLPYPSEYDLDIIDQMKYAIDGDTIAYIMFTSGSTGVPKGVAVTHQNLIHFINWGINRFNIRNGSRLTNLNPMFFDNSVFDFYVSLFSGATLVPINKLLLNNPYELIEYISIMKCTVWFSVPSLLIYLTTIKVISLEKLSHIKFFIFGGEGYPKIELIKLYNIFSENSTLINVYGPTECTCICSAYEINNNDFIDLNGFPPLGRLNENFDYKILNNDNLDDSFGELCLIGPNIASGYFNDTELTYKSFMHLTESNRFMKKMYKTGDIVKIEKDILYFIGRKDNQIKHMGYRIELEEIENNILLVTNVRQAKVIYHKTNNTFGKIIAFISLVAQIDDASITIDNELKNLLPSFMLPHKIIVLDDLPINQNGKIDRNVLINYL
jgi:D-alanine--poly(phosphoribitol) ligase subunit 1